MNTTTKNIKTLIIYISSLLIVLSIFSSVDENSFEKHFCNSDTLYLPSLYDDLFINHNPISDFYLNPAPNFFPDMIFYFLLKKIFNFNIIATAITFASFQVFFLALLLKSIGNKLSKNSRIIDLGFFMMLLFAIPSIYEDNFLFTFYWLINSYHLGSFIVSLVLLLLVYQKLYKEKNRNLFIAILTFLAVISDKSIVINFVIPITLTLLFLTSVRTLRKKLTITTLVPIYLGVILGYLFLFLAERLGWLMIASDKVSVDFEKIKFSFFFFIENTIITLEELSVSSLLIAISSISYVLNIILVYRERKSPRFLDVYFLFFIAIMTTLPILAGKITGLDSIRYNYQILIVLVFLFPYFLHRVLANNSISYNFNIGSIAFIGLFLLLISNFNYNKLVRKINFYPNETKIIDANKNKLGLQNGLSTYWKSKKNTMFSKEHILIRCIHENLKPYTHVVSKNWLYKKGQKIIYNFIIIDDDAMLKTVSEKFDSVETIHLSERLIIAKTEPFYFDEHYNIAMDK